MSSPSLLSLLRAAGSDEVWFEGLVRHLMAASPEGGPDSPRSERLAALTHLLQVDPFGPLWRARIRAIWSHASAVRFLADTGMPVHTGFGREAMERVVSRLVPSLDPEGDLSAYLGRLQLTELDANWIAGLTETELQPWRELLALPAESVWDAVQLLAYRAAALGLARDLLVFAPAERELDSPFGRLPDAAVALRQGRDPGWDGLLEACRDRLRTALDHLEQHGISSELVYRLELLETLLKRMQELVALGLGNLDNRAFAATLVRQTAEHRSVLALVRGTMRRLARKVVEHTGQTGDHYIANTRAEWRATFGSAAGGGALTAFTAGLKYGIAAMPLAPMVAGLAFALNYTLSFITMQFAHFTLASKQPAMTAASLAGALEDPGREEQVVDLVAGITRSQIMATLGNVLVTIPAALLLGLGWAALTGETALSAETAAHSLRSLHPLRSWTVPFAILTGGFLWLSSLAAGWASNWSAFRRLPEAVASQPRLRRWLGPAGAARVGQLLEQHLGGVVGYAVLGFLLGFMPVVFTFMGLHLEVRHVTLSAAGIGLCLAQAMGSGLWPGRDLGWALLGIAAIGVCNFWVSFDLALRTARRARGLDPAGMAGLHQHLGRAFRRRPWRFLGPPPLPAAVDLVEIPGGEDEAHGHHDEAHGTAADPVGHVRAEQPTQGGGHRHD
jgi:site-specific recombinase